MCKISSLRGAAALAALSTLSVIASADLFFSENFEGVTNLQVPDGEGQGGLGTWDNTPVWSTNPASPTLSSWTFDNSGVAGSGVNEWDGWSVANKQFWVEVAGDQQRSQFTFGEGHVAVADPDEYDDINPGIPDNDYFNAFMTTGVIDLSLAANDLTLTFASSWRDEAFDDGDNTNNQTAKIRGSFDGGATWTDILHWNSDSTSQFFKNDAPNEMVTLNFAKGGDSLILEFGLTQARNDWWWAVDNIELEAEAVPEPMTMTVLGLGALAALRRKKSK